MLKPLVAKAPPGRCTTITAASGNSIRNIIPSSMPCTGKAYRLPNQVAVSPTPDATQQMLVAQAAINSERIENSRLIAADTRTATGVRSTPSSAQETARLITDERASCELLA